MENLNYLIDPFIASVAVDRSDVYNEFSLQHEFGIYLRGRLPADKVQFERNVGFFFRESSPFTKREIDISVFSPDKRDLKLAIELKYPRNGQYPEQMFSFCKDIAFVEELKAAGFSKAALIIFAEDSLFYRGSCDGIYGFFRGGKRLSGQVLKPTGTKPEVVVIRASYDVRWKVVVAPLMYTVIEVPDHT